MSAGEFIGPARIDGRRTPLGRYLNHADRPNAVMRPRGRDLHVYVVLSVGRRRELTVDYAQVLAINAEAPSEWRG